MNKDSNTASDEKVFFITKEQFQNKLKAQYHSQAELKSVLDDVKRNGSFFQLLSAAGKKLMWHTIQGDHVQPEDVLKSFNRSSIRSSRANEVPEGAIVLKKKKSAPLNNLYGLGLAAAQVAVPLGLMADTVGKLNAAWSASYNNTVIELMPVGDKMIDVAIKNARLSEWANVAVNTNSAMMVAATAALAGGTLLLSKKPWSAASAYRFADDKALFHAKNIINETAKLMDKEFLERKQSPEKRYYLDKNSVMAYAADHPAEAAALKWAWVRGFNPRAMFEGQNWRFYVNETTGKVPDGAVRLEGNPSSGFNLLGKESLRKCQDLISKTLSQNLTSEKYAAR